MLTTGFYTRWGRKTPWPGVLVIEGVAREDDKVPDAAFLLESQSFVWHPRQANGV
jgi:hypothetical protein